MKQLHNMRETMADSLENYVMATRIIQPDLPDAAVQIQWTMDMLAVLHLKVISLQSEMEFLRSMAAVAVPKPQENSNGF